MAMLADNYVTDYAACFFHETGIKVSSWKVFFQQHRLLHHSANKMRVYCDRFPKCCKNVRTKINS